MDIQELHPRDTNKAIQFAITGMHFDLYLKSPLLQRLYGRYFWFMEMNRATQIIAAYEGDTLAGVLLAAMKGEPPACHSRGRAAFVRFVDGIQRRFFQGSAGVYDQVNQELFAQYTQNHAPDGEIIFLAANPDVHVKGIGTLLLNELARREQGREVYLYTDSACTYQFYEHRAFRKVGEKEIEMDCSGRAVRLNCLLYAKVL